MKHVQAFLLFLLVPLFLQFPLIAYSHPGEIDSNCGHRNNKTGKYHYHNWRICRQKGSPSKPSRQLSPVLRGIVRSVKEGDTVVITPAVGDQFITCRLYGIDAPETPKKGKPGQPYAIEATKELRDLIYDQTVTINLIGEKTYGREVCIIIHKGVSINLEMLRRGYAWAFKRYLNNPYASEYVAAEEEARRMGRGIWKQVNPMPPWEWTRRN